MKKFIMFFLIIFYVTGSKEYLLAYENSFNKVSSRNIIQKEAKKLAENGEYDKALELYNQAIKSEYINEDYEKGVSIMSMVNILKVQGKYDEALKAQAWFSDRKSPAPSALEEKREIEALINFKKYNNSKMIYEFIAQLKESHSNDLPPKKYTSSAPIIIVKILMLYDTITDFDSGIKFIDECLDYMYKQNPDVKKVSNSSEAQELMIKEKGKKGGGYAYKVLREYYLVREAFEKDKANGTKGSATKALIQSDYFPW